MKRAAFFAVSLLIEFGSYGAATWRTLDLLFPHQVTTTTIPMCPVGSYLAYFDSKGTFDCVVPRG